MGIDTAGVSRIAIIGCGAVTEKKHLPALAASTRVKVTALMDLDAARVDRLADQFDVPVRARTVADLASHADIALVAVPHHLHARVGVEAMAAGLHAFIEKPLATTMADVALLQDAARRHDRRIGVGLVRRQYASFKLAASVLGSGMLGAIQSFDFREGGVYNWPVATDTTFRRKTAGGVTRFFRLSSDSRFAANRLQRCEVQDPAALLAGNDLLPRFHARRGRSRYFHVAAGANTMLDGDDGRVTFTVEHALELIEQIGVDFGRKRFPLGFKFLLPASQRF